MKRKTMKQRCAAFLILVLLLVAMPLEAFSGTGTAGLDGGSATGQSTDSNAAGTASGSNLPADPDAFGNIPIIDDRATPADAVKFGRKNPAGPVLTVTFDSGDNEKNVSLTENAMKDAVEQALSDGGDSKAEIVTIVLAGDAERISDHNWRYLLELYGEGSEWSKLSVLDLSGMGELVIIENVNSRDKIIYITSLTDVVLPDSLECVGAWAFYQCGNLELAELPDGVTSIGEAAFYHCYNLALTELPDGITSIGEYAFYSCNNLALTELPEGVTSIGVSAFSGCEKLALTTLPAGITSIHWWTFGGCRELKEMAFPEGLTSIGFMAFVDCNNLSTLIFTSKLAPDIGDEVFIGLPTTGTLYYPSGADYDAIKSQLPSGWEFIESSVIKSTSDDNGTITPSGQVPVAVGKDQEFVITANSGYEIAEILVDGSSVRTYDRSTVSDTYIFTDVTENHTIEVHFRPAPVPSYRSGSSGSSGTVQGTWKRDLVGWWYEYPNGTYLQAEWKQIDGIWYYFDASGYMANGWRFLDGKWYWLNLGTGRMVRNDWIWYQDYWYYLGSDGAMVTGWLEYKEAWYFLSTVNDQYYGHMLRNQTTPDGYYVNQDGVRTP